MGPHPLWLLEDLVDDLALRAGMRVLDLGFGRGASALLLLHLLLIERLADALLDTAQA